MDSRAVHRHARTAGCLYQAVLRGELTQRLGVEWGPVRKGVAELACIPEPLRRAFSNLLRNASEAMQGRGTIDVSLAIANGSLTVAVADHGPGIPAELRHQVFEPYFTTKADGTGLGLALVRQAVEAHRGTLSVSETPGGGATFTVTFAA